MPNGLESIFPNLKDTRYRIISPRTPRYNCIAFAAGRDDRWWWPGPNSYWPPNIPREETLAAFISAFETLGYLPSGDGSLEEKLEKVAIYANQNGTPTHMARQLATGIWISKCG